MLLEPTLAAIAAQAIRRTFGLEEEVDPLLRATSDRRHGDFQLNAAMALSKRLGRKPRELAEEIAEALGAERCVQGTEIAGPGFVNIRLSDAWIAERLAMMLEDAERHGVPRVDLPETIVVDFSSPNIAKQMHVGHLRSTIIGDSIVRMLRFVGHRVIGDNHLGDWGTQFGLLLLGMREWGSEAALEADAIVELERVYKLASTRSEADEAFAEAARAELVKLQAGDAENRALWERFVSTSRAKLEEVYAMLGVEFDEWLGESAYHDRLAGVVQALEERGIAREDQGAICVFFAGLEGAPKELRKTEAPLVIRKRDGAFLYSTTDLATALYRRERFAADRCVYVVDKRQGLHFKQLFAVLGALGVPLELEHVGFGMVLGDDGKPMRTRDASGALITLASLLEESKVRALERIEEGRATGRLRIADESLEEAARVLGIGSVKYADLRQNRLSDYRFEWEKMISFEGDAMP
ncbi:MAG: arginine--tRNA ligase, partial [Myxococcales bacterium]|nr:arginine--tRNA ligase [Myxococcales bacterium]